MAAFFQAHLQERRLFNPVEHHESVDAEVRRLVQLLVAEAVVVDDVDVVGDRVLRRTDRGKVVAVERSSRPTTRTGWVRCSDVAICGSLVCLKASFWATNVNSALYRKKTSPQAIY